MCFATSTKFFRKQVYARGTSLTCQSNGPCNVNVWALLPFWRNPPRLTQFAVPLVYINIYGSEFVSLRTKRCRDAGTQGGFHQQYCYASISRAHFSRSLVER